MAVGPVFFIVEVGAGSGHGVHGLYFCDGLGHIDFPFLVGGWGWIPSFFFWGSRSLVWRGALGQSINDQLV